MISDLIIIAIIVIFTAIGIKRGFAKTVLGFAGMIAAVLSANYLSGISARLIYDSFIKQTVIQNLNEAFSLNPADFSPTVIIGALPDWVKVPVSVFAGNSQEALSSFEEEIYSAAGNGLTSAAAAAESAVSEIVISVLSVILVVLLFFIIYFIIRRLLKLVLKIFDIPVVKQINKFLGGVFGAGEGLAAVWLAVNCAYIIISLNSPGILSDETYFGSIFRALSTQT